MEVDEAEEKGEAGGSEDEDEDVLLMAESDDEEEAGGAGGAGGGQAAEAAAAEAAAGEAAGTAASLPKQEAAAVAEAVVKPFAISGHAAELAGGLAISEYDFAPSTLRRSRHPPRPTAHDVTPASWRLLAAAAAVRGMMNSGRGSRTLRRRDTDVTPTLRRRYTRAPYVAGAAARLLGGRHAP